MKKYIIVLGMLTFFSGTFTVAQNKVLTIKDYKQWSRIVGTELSDNGNWMAYALRPNGGDDTLTVQSLNNSSSYKIPNANNAVFSSDNKWVAYLITPDSETRKKLSKSKKPIFNTAELLNLSSGEKIKVNRANAISFTEDGNTWLVHRKKPDDDDTKHKGSDLIIHNLKESNVINVGNVAEFVANKRSTKLAYVVDANEMAGNGLYIYDLKTGAISPIHTDSATYENLTWDDKISEENEWASKGNKLAVLFGITEDGFTYRNNSLLTVDNISKTPILKILNSQSNSDFPEGMIISEDGSLSWTENGKTVLFGIRDQEEKMKLSKDTVANVDVWHWKDDRIQTVQMRRYNRDINFTYTSAYHPEKNLFVQLSDEDMRDVNISENGEFMVGRDEKPYMNDVNWGVSPADLYRVNIKNGDKSVFAENIKRTLGYSPNGRYYLYQKMNGDQASLVLFDLEKNKRIDLTKNSPVQFSNVEHIYPHENPPYGIAGWTLDGKSVIVNHKYDLWMLSLDGSEATNITKGIGEKNNIIFRYASLENDDYINTDKELLLTAFGEWTKKDGFYSLKIGNNPKSLLFEDASFGRAIKAEDSDKVILTRQTFVKFPDYYSTNTSFKNLKKVTNANPQQSEYAWGTRKLITFENGKGQKVQGTLTLPANYEKGQKYPMIIYFYEKMSDRHHQYSMPTYDDRPHMSTYASNGYAVFMPDILFEEGRPGTSSLDGITAAANAVIDEGVADPENIGLQGHSWAGYQTSFILTQTNMFKTIVTGAPPTNLESFYNNIYGSSGTNHHGIMEIGQVRMGRGVTPWSAREVYQRENPMYHAPKIDTPFMILHGTEDGAVDWSQGLEFFNAARRLGKEVIFLSYPGEGHHLGVEANQVDFQIRMKQYFDHHLKGAEAPDWMINGVPQTEKLYRKAN
ncbi:MAG: prolyl oligopeptidase family serine peptidase [Balneola sp.]